MFVFLSAIGTCLAFVGGILVYCGRGKWASLCIPLVISALVCVVYSTQLAEVSRYGLPLRQYNLEYGITYEVVGDNSGKLVFLRRLDEKQAKAYHLDQVPPPRFMVIRDELEGSIELLPRPLPIPAEPESESQ